MGRHVSKIGNQVREHIHILLKVKNGLEAKEGLDELNKVPSSETLLRRLGSAREAGTEGEGGEVRRSDFSYLELQQSLNALRSFLH